MKVRRDFVTNSSSSSFVICKNEIDEKYIKYIEDKFTHTSSEDLSFDCYYGNVDDIYYLVDYKSEDEYMHIWVRRDEAMDDDFIDDILFEKDKSAWECWDEKSKTFVENESYIEPKFSYHY